MYGDHVLRETYAEIKDVEEEHVTMYESLIDPAETMWEKFLIHEFTEVCNYYTCTEDEVDERIKKYWELALDMEITHLQIAAEMFKKYENRDPEEVIGEKIVIPNRFLSQKSYVQKVLEAEVDKRLDRDGKYTTIDNLPEDWPSYPVQERAAQISAPSENAIHIADSVFQSQMLQQADSVLAQVEKKRAHHEAENHPKTNHQAAEVKKEEPSLHDQLIKIVAGESYVDMGLPSGTLWKTENEEGLMDFNTAKKKFKKRMPALSQWEELRKYCAWSWTGNGYEVIGPNGTMIFIPAAGYRNVSGQIGKVGVFGNYWSSTIKNKEEAWRVGFESDKFSMATHSRRYGRSVRLVYTPILAPLENLE